MSKNAPENQLNSFIFQRDTAKSKVKLLPNFLVHFYVSLNSQATQRTKNRRTNAQKTRVLWTTVWEQVSENIIFYRVPLFKYAGLGAY